MGIPYCNVMMDIVVHLPRHKRDSKLSSRKGKPRVAVASGGGSARPAIKKSKKSK
jgi:hypothetical protein